MFRRRLGWTLVTLSLLLHVFTVYCFSRQPDRFAAFTVMPIWLWGGIGLLFAVLAFYFLRAPLSLVMSGVWALTLLVGADEARVLANFGKSAPEPGTPAIDSGHRVIRVITANCGQFYFGDPAPDIAAWQPDIVLLQEAHPHQVDRIRRELFGEGGHHRFHRTNGIISRWEIVREVKSPLLRSLQVTVALPGGSHLEAVSVHLDSAATDLRLWDRQAWRSHRQNRILRQAELSQVLAVMSSTTRFPETPVIFGGDFNSPAGDPVHLQLAADFTDTFAAAGTGWGNTFHRRLPILRIDRIYVSRHFTPLRSRVIVTRKSDHRMVVADLFPPTPLPP
jgi:endonuclease/exonuclease/phosphatase (EEP) superfamily protein YafD